MVGTGVTQKTLALKKGRIMEQEIDWEKEIYGRGYARIDREQFRRKKGDFWGGLNGIGSDGTLMMEWERMFSASVGLIKPFLKLTGQAQEYIACPGSSNCGCAHYVSETVRGELVATCQCSGEDDWDCETYQLEPEDVLVHGLDWHLFGDEIREALVFAQPAGAAYVSRDLREIGTYAAVATPVYLCLAGERALLRELAKLQGLREGPFLVLTATGSTWSEEVEAIARPHGGWHISLSSVLAPEGRGFRVVGALQPMLGEFAKRMGSLRRAGETLVSIHREIAAVRQDYTELRTAKQRLEKMLAEGMFAFTRKVDAKSFQAFCTILAEGDVSKAARTLEIGDSTLRDLLRDWARRGGAYERMLDVVRWRKQVGRTETVPLNDDLILGKARSTDYPALLSELLDGLLSMTESNWEDLSKELAGMLKVEIG
jgi:hypothetical protein